MYSRTIVLSLYTNSSRRMFHTRPSYTVSLRVTATSTGSSRRSVIVDVEQLARSVAVERRRHEAAEERVRVRRARPQLGVRLRRDVVRMHVARKLDELDEVAVRRQAGEDETRFGELLAVRVVDLVTVAVALVHQRRAVHLLRHGSLGQVRRVQAQAHRAA